MRLFCVPVLAAALAGCATMNAEKTFAPIQADAEARLQQDIEWVGITAPEEEIVARVNTLLKDELSAQDAVQIALLFNRRLQGHFEKLGIARADVVQASRLSNPVVEVTQLFEDGKSGNRSLELVLVQDFLDLLLMPVRQQATAAAYEQVRLEVTADVVRTASRTRMAFYDLQAAQQNLELFQQVLLAMEASFEWAQALRKAGNVPLDFLLRERAQYERTKLQVAEAELRVVEQRERLNRLMGLWGEATGWTAELRLPPVPEQLPDVTDMERQALEASLDLAGRRQGLLRTAHSLGVRNAEQVLSGLEVGMQAEREKEGGENGPWHRGPVVSVAVPIFDQGQGVRGKSQALFRQAWDEYHATAVDVRSVARLAGYQLKYAAQRARYLHGVVLPMHEQLLLQMQLRYNAMFTGTLELLDAARQDIEVAQEYVEALRGYWQAQAQVEELLAGTLPETLLDAPLSIGRQGEEQQEQAH